MRQIRSDARIYGVKYDADGEPNWEDVRRAAERCVLIRVKLGQTGEDETQASNTKSS